ncbi:MAG TPA: tetratricopeptide repeat protein [Thermoanaerobaculia bacterium]|nr:tetratricopeptide repeat protein [Thermoanaerobaculia bacterium]
MDKGDLDAAIKRGEEAVAADRGDSETWLWLGRAYGRKAQTASVFSKVGFAKKCRSAFEKAVALDPRSVDAREDLISYYLQAPGIVGGSKEKAREQAAELAKLDAARGYIANGWILADDKDHDGAEAQFSKALEADPTGFRGAVALGNFYVAQKRWGDARTLWQRRLDSSAADAMARYQLARIAYFSGTDLEKGVEHLRAYLAVPAPPGRPTWADAHWRLGLLYEKLGRLDDAKAEMREALKLVPGHLQAQKDLGRLQK